MNAGEQIAWTGKMWLLAAFMFPVMVAICKLRQRRLKALEEAELDEAYFSPMYARRRD